MGKGKLAYSSAGGQDDPPCPILRACPAEPTSSLIVAGPVLAVSLLAVNAVAGRAVVEAVYDGRTPVDLLNDIITGQSVYPVDYHLHRASCTGWRGCWAPLVPWRRRTCVVGLQLVLIVVMKARQDFF